MRLRTWLHLHWLLLTRRPQDKWPRRERTATTTRRNRLLPTCSHWGLRPTTRALFARWVHPTNPCATVGVRRAPRWGFGVRRPARRWLLTPRTTASFHRVRRRRRPVSDANRQYIHVWDCELQSEERRELTSIEAHEDIDDRLFAHTHSAESVVEFCRYGTRKTVSNPLSSSYFMSLVLCSCCCWWRWGRYICIDCDTGTRQRSTWQAPAVSCPG